MKRIVIYILLCMLGLALVGCGSTSSTTDTSTEVLLTDAIVFYIGWATMGGPNYSTTASNFASDPSSISNTYTYNSQTGFWNYAINGTIGGITTDIDFSIGLYAAGSENPSQNPVTVDKVAYYGTMTMSTSTSNTTYTWGSGSASPIYYSGFSSGSAITIDGPFAVSSSGDSSSSVSLTYSALPLDTSNNNIYPNGTLSNITCVYDGITYNEISVAFNGTNTVVVTYGSNTYTLNLDTRVVS